MNGRSRNEEVSPQLLDLIPTDREWHENRDEERSHRKSSEERKLELRLAPPGEEDDVARGRDESLLSLGYFSAPINGGRAQKTASSPWASSAGFQEKKTQTINQHRGVSSSFLQSQPSPANTAVPNSSQKRTAPGPVVGWPPIRSFRKNLASSSSSKVAPQHESQNQHVVEDKVAGKKPVADNNVVGGKGLFVKINMDGVPIGRKVDLNAYDSYEKLSSAVDELFRGLLAAVKGDAEIRVMCLSFCDTVQLKEILVVVVVVGFRTSKRKRKLLQVYWTEVENTLWFMRITKETGCLLGMCRGTCSCQQ
ncbi:auxin-responsive protein IAA26 isoform X2 [Neltuma alba]|uniref:auxin-responsive protein IAA26 isoform X2 n=1 Tax=Neltuma alba TaxID=207710 RepID=UPI0010A4519B|nr:auxin-responsive protein IAA26 isoform X2 [Prosopis alba]